MSKEVNWDVDGILLRDHDLPELPDSPYCPSLVKLSLQAHSLIVIPPTFFERMPMLEVLDLSNTSIVSLPTSISSLSSLQEFFLRDCSNLIELPTDIGMLTKLKLFDIKGTELMFIPKEIGELKDLEAFRVSLSQNAKCYIKAQGVIETVIPRKMISKLKKLKELCISVPPEAEWWEEEVKDFQNELCDLENLQTLGWYLPTNEVLQRFLLLERNHVPLFANLSNLTLTIGHHAHLISCLPLGLEKKFEEFKKCLKWINAEGSMDDVTKIMAGVEALFLSRHWTLKNLSTFNFSKLKYCLLAECNEMETLIEAHEDEETRIKNGEKVGLEFLQYLSIHCMKKLRSIWRGPIGKDSLSKLTILALHTCPQLTLIFSPTIAQNLSCLIELVVEDCPKVRSLISNESHIDIHGQIFPTLDRIFLLDLPELVNIFGGLIILEKLSTLLIYNCLKLRDLSLKGLPHIKKIEAETEWWEDLELPNKPLLKNFFVPLKERRDLIDQLFEATNSLQHFHDTISHDVRKQSEKGSSSGWSPGLPLLEGPFEGYDDQVQYLKEMVLKDSAVDDCSVVVVSGPEACGKTTLVTMLCHDPEVQGKFARNIYFAKISLTYDLKVIIANLLPGNKLKLPDFTSDQVAIEAWRSFLDENRSEILLVLDDVWSDSIVTDLQFKSPGYKILVTSRKAFTQFQTYDMQSSIQEDAESPRSSMAVELALVKKAVSESSEVIILAMKETPSFKYQLKYMEEMIKSIFLGLKKLKYETDLGNDKTERFITKWFIKLLKKAEVVVQECKNFKSGFSRESFSRHLWKLDHMNRSLRLMFARLDIEWQKARNTNDFEKGSSSGWSSGAPMRKGDVIGFDDRVRDLKAMVLKDSPEDDCSIVVVSGAGGCGKTTLVKMLFHDPEIQGRFGRNVHFVTVSQSFDLKVIITKLLGRELPSNTNNEEAMQQWRSFLGENESEILLILDNVWSDSVITDFKFKSPRYKILVTSRCTFEQFKTYQLQVLNNKDATLLFRRSAFPEHRDVPDDLVDKCCKNHPLLLSVVGGMLKEKPPASWEFMLKELSEEKKFLLDFNESILTRLEKSLHLFDEEPHQMKICYLDLGLFPQDRKIAATALMDIWAHLYKHDREGLDTMRVLSAFSSKNLVTLLQKRNRFAFIINPCKEQYAMQHDMMRELAIRLSSKEPILHRLIINSYGQDLSLLPQKVNALILSISTDERRFPLTWNEIQAPNVEVFVLNFMSNTHDSLPRFMQTMERLKVLILTSYGYYFPEIQNFPVPKYLSELRRIRLEHISISSITSPILQLMHLEKLSLIKCKIGSSFNNFGIIIMLFNLLEIDIEACDDLVQFPKTLCNLNRLKKLSITNCHELTSLSEEFGELSNLEVLQVASCSKLTTLPESVRNLKNLKIIDLSHCKSLRELPRHIGELGSLEEIDATGCTGLQEMPESVKCFDEVTVFCDKETSHLWSDFKNVNVLVEED